jgi:outer membrane protein TolC
MKRCYFFGVVLALACNMAHAAAMPTLDELEARIDGSRAMQILDAQYEVARNRLLQQSGSRGASFYSQTSVSDNDEVVDVGRSRSYRQFSSGVGIRVPVLGSRLQWRESVDQQELRLARLDSERELQRRALLRDLRTAYASYWASQRQLSLIRSYLEHEESIDRNLTLRTRAGLLLDADRLEFMSGFSMARRDRAVAEASGARALQTLRFLANDSVPEGVALHPAVAPSCAPSESNINAWVSEHPEIRFLQQAEGSALATRLDSPLYGVNSEIRVGYHTSTEWPVEQQGGSAAIMWSFDVPINFMDQRRLSRAAADATRSHAQLEYELRRQQLEHELRSLLAQRASLEESLHFAALRLAAGDEAVRERELRATKLAGDVIEQLQQARLARYSAAKAVVDAELALANWAAEWSMHAPLVCRPRALYVWSSQHLIERLAAGDTYSVSDPDGTEKTTTLLVSLDASQIREYGRETRLLREALQTAHRRGMRVELLLGEPTWLLPEHRAELVSILRDLRTLPFDGLHLDIEPDQLAGVNLNAATLWSQWLETVRSAREASAWPVDVSLHPRYLNEPVDGRSLGEHLTQDGISVTLMIYVANAERAVEIAQPLLQRYPSLAQRVALSTEDTLSREESLHYVDADERARRIALIESKLAVPNFRGVTIQPSLAKARTDLVMSR